MERYITYMSGVIIFFLHSDIVTVGRQIFVHQNQTVTLPCTQTSNITPSWSGPGNISIYTSGYNINPDLEKEDRLKLITNKTLGPFNLQIINFSPDDEGYYMCSSINIGGMPLKDENISVFIKNTPAAQILQGSAINVTEGDTLSLFCNVSSIITNATVKWERKKNEFCSSSRMISENQQYDIHRVDRSDAGVYTCIVTSPEGSSEDNISVEVQYAPEISLEYTKAGLLKCVPHGVPNHYTFSKWEHKTEFNDHIRYIDDDGNGQIHISNDLNLNDGYEYHNRGIYVCYVSNGVQANGTNIQSKKYLLALEGKPYFTTANTAVHYVSYATYVTINIYAVSFPGILKILVFKPNFEVDVIDYHHLDITKIKDTAYGKKVFVKGYIIPIRVTTHSDYQSYTVEVTNYIGSTNYTLYLTFADVKAMHVAAYIIPFILVGLIVILLLVLYYRFWKGIIGGVDNEVYELENNIAAATGRHDPDDKVYSSIDRRRRLSVGQTVSYSVVKNKKIKAPTQKEHENVHRQKRSKRSKAAEKSVNNAASEQLNYIDICFDPKPKEFKSRIHGIEDKSDYVEIDFDKSAEMKRLPSDDDSDDDFASIDDVKQMKRKTQLEHISLDETHTAAE